MKKVSILVVAVILIVVGIGLFYIYYNMPSLSPILSERSQAELFCIKKCQSAVESGQNLNDGPCLSNEIISNWVCDIAHSPRQPVDNLAKNQCSAYREGVAKHFVEVDTDCKLIRTA